MLTVFALRGRGPSAGLVHRAVSVTSVAVAIGITRPEFVDVDRLLGTTLVYGSLVAASVVVDVLVLGATSWLLDATLDSRESLVVAVIITLVVYIPLRHRLSRVVRRWVMGERDDPSILWCRPWLAELEEAHRHGPRDRAAARRSPGRSGTALRLPLRRGRGAAGGRRRCSSSSTGVADAARALPIAYRGEQVGRLLLTRGTAPRPVAAEPTERLLADVVPRSGGHAARTARLARRRLQRSRGSFVTAVGGRSAGGCVARPPRRPRTRTGGGRHASGAAEHLLGATPSARAPMLDRAQADVTAASPTSAGSSTAFARRRSTRSACVGARAARGRRLATPGAPASTSASKADRPGPARRRRGRRLPHRRRGAHQRRPPLAGAAPRCSVSWPPRALQVEVDRRRRRASRRSPAGRRASSPCTSGPPSSGGECRCRPRRRARARLFSPAGRRDRGGPARRRRRSTGSSSPTTIPVFRRGSRRCSERSRAWQVVGEAEDGASRGRARRTRLQPDVVRHGPAHARARRHRGDPPDRRTQPARRRARPDDVRGRRRRSSPPCAPARAATCSRAPTARRSCARCARSPAGEAIFGPGRSPRRIAEFFARPRRSGRRAVPRAHRRASGRCSTSIARGDVEPADRRAAVPLAARPCATTCRNDLHQAPGGRPRRGDRAWAGCRPRPLTINGRRAPQCPLDIALHHRGVGVHPTSGCTPVCSAA